MNASKRTLAGPALALFSVIATAQDVPAKQLMLNIEAQPMVDALNGWAQQTGMQIIVPEGKDTKHLVAPSVKGHLTAQQALIKLLDGSSLTYEFVNERTVVVHDRRPTKIVAEGSRNRAQVLGVGLVRDNAELGDAEPTEDHRQLAATERESEGGERRTRDLEEVIVTAQKQEQRLKDVPVPVTAISAAKLVDSNQTKLQDYYTKVPGLNLTVRGDGGAPQVAIRGVTTGGIANPTVGVVVDDIPFGASTVIVSGSLTAAPDFDPSELARVEVLRGPQGTLYGASSMGGLLKFVTADPSTDRIGGRLQVGTSGVHKSDDLGYSVRGSVNIPLSDTFAVRASASSRRDPGYIDNIQTGEEDVNSIDSKGVRVAALWRPNDIFSLKLSALYQQTERNGSSDVTLPSPLGPQTPTASGRPDLGDLQQSELINTGWYDQTLQAYSAIAKAELGQTQLTSLTGYSRSEFSTSVDATATYGSFSQARFGTRGTATPQDPEAEKFSQEVRLAWPLGSRVDLLVGAFYTHERTPSTADVLAINPDGSIAGSGLHSVLSSTYDEYAAFTNLTFKFTERFDVQIGARQSHNELDYSGTVSTGPFTAIFGVPDPYIQPPFESEDDALTYLLTPRFKATEDLMMYARFASGYRPGGVSALSAPVPGIPTQYDHDTVQTYEFGIKADVLDQLLSIDASIYYIDWKDVQLQIRDTVNPSVAYTVNSGKARSEGVELALDIRPLDGLTVSASGAYNDAELTSVPPTITVAARSGDRLPYSARRSGSLSLDQEFHLTSNMIGFVAGDFIYVGDRKGRFLSGLPQGSFPAYTQVDLRGGAKMDNWTVSVFVNNLADKRGVLRAGRDAAFPYLVTYIQPRAVGLNVSHNW
jgi:outer membrane receptor protein involved in Fe transport